MDAVYEILRYLSGIDSPKGISRTPSGNISMVDMHARQENS